MLVTDWFNKKYLPKKTDDTLVKTAYITYNGVNYVPNQATPSDMVKEQIVIKRKKPLDALMDEIRAAQAKLPAKSRRPMEVYLPADASKDAPSKTDPRVDDGAAPPAPANLKLLAANNGNLTLTFNASTANDVVGYRIYRSENQAAFEKFGTSILAGEDTKVSFTASKAQSYTYYVTAIDVVGKESAPSELVQYGTVPTIPDQPSTDGGNPNGNESGMSVPSAPTGLQAESSAVSVKLSWASNTVSEQVTQYHVYYSSNNDGQYSRIASTSETNFEYVAPLVSGVFYVTSENGKGESNASAQVTVSNN